MSGSEDDQEYDSIRTGGCVALSPHFLMSHLPAYNEYPSQLLDSLWKGQGTSITHLTPAQHGCSHTSTLELYHLPLVFSTRPGVLEPASRILNLEVAILTGDATKTTGKFINLYQGQVLNKFSDILLPNTVAIKLLRLDRDNEMIAPGGFSTEVMQRVWNHPNICPLWSLHLVADAKPAVAMPWFSRGNILDWLLQDPALDKLVVVQQIADAISYLHGLDAVHGNITPSNIMIADDSRAFLTDVGLHAQLSKLAYSGTWPIPHDWMFKAREELLPECDDPLYFVHTKAMDVYSFASTMYTIFTSKPPFMAKSWRKGLIQILSGKSALEKPTEVTDTLWDLLTRCWAPLPEDRPSITIVKAELMAM